MIKWIKSLFTGVYYYGKPGTGRFVVLCGTQAEQDEQVIAYLNKR